MRVACGRSRPFISSYKGRRFGFQNTKNTVANERYLTDIMLLIHRTLSAEAALVQDLIEGHQIEDSLQNFRLRFHVWAAMLMYHADTEDRYMTAPLTDFELARSNEAEHAELGDLAGGLAQYLEDRDAETLEQRVKAAAIALHSQQHDKLLEALEDVLAVLDVEIGKTKLIPRTLRHLYGKVVSLRICQDDHFESEEALVLPEVEARFSSREKQEIAHKLLIDEGADDPTWVLSWVIENTESTGRESLISIKDTLTQPD